MAEAADTILTFKEHPLLLLPFYGLHPCRTREVLALIRESTARDPNAPPYLFSWLSIVGQLVPVPQPVWTRRYPVYVPKLSSSTASAAAIVLPSPSAPVQHPSLAPQQNGQNSHSHHHLLDPDAKPITANHYINGQNGAKQPASGLDEKAPLLFS